MYSSHSIVRVTCLRLSSRRISAQSGSTWRRWPCFVPAAANSAVSSAVSVISAGNGQLNPALASRFKVNRTVDGETPTRRAISLSPTPAVLKRSTSRTWRIVVLSAGIHSPMQKPKERTLIGPAEAPLNRATSSRNGGRNHLGTPSDIKSEWWATSSRIRGRLRPESADMKRRLERKTAGELGDEAEVDLFGALKREFGGDEIVRVPKGRNGADIIHRVVEGTACGKLTYDAKAHKRWLNSFTTKLRQDQVAEQADHAVLVSAVFPAGAQQLAVRDGVVIVHPARVIALAHLLRRHTIQLHTLRLGNEGRAEKTAKLYEFMISDRARHLWDQIANYE